MPLNCSTFVTQKEQLKCQAARGAIKFIINEDESTIKTENVKSEKNNNE